MNEDQAEELLSLLREMKSSLERIERKLGGSVSLPPVRGKIVRRIPGETWLEDDFDVVGEEDD